MNEEGSRNQKPKRHDLILKDEAFKIIGAAMEAHRILGPGFLEAVYQEALAIEFARYDIPFQAQAPLRIAYRETILGKRYFADFLAFDQILVEIKCLPRLGPPETAQLINYLRATNLPLGLLINFGAQGKLEWKRLANSLAIPSRPL